MHRRLGPIVRTLLQGAYGVAIEIVALVALFTGGAVIAVVLSQLV